MENLKQFIFINKGKDKKKIRAILPNMYFSKLHYNELLS